MFDPLNRKNNKCDQPFNLDCGDRIELRMYCIFLIKTWQCVSLNINYFAPTEIVTCAWYLNEW
jgi:hypothetical protein